MNVAILWLFISQKLLIGNRNYYIKSREHLDCSKNLENIKYNKRKYWWISLIMLIVFSRLVACALTTRQDCEWNGKNNDNEVILENAELGVKMFYNSKKIY